MRIYYDEISGEIFFTMTLSGGTQGPSGTYIEIEDQEIDLLDMWVQDGELVARTGVSDAQRARALEKIKQIRSNARLLFVTDIPGQSAIYIAKNEEAIHLLLNHGSEDEVSLLDYPLIASEVGVTAPTAWDVAQVFANLNLMWRHAAGAIDGLCFLAENQVLSANTPTVVASVVSNLEAQISFVLGGS